MNIVFLDADTLGKDLDLIKLEKLGTLTKFGTTNQDQVVNRCANADIIITNKVKINKEIIDCLPELKLICEAATGLDNIDVNYAHSKSIQVKNVIGYSTASVVQHTFSLVLYLLNDLSYYDEFTSSGGWEKSPTFSHFKPFCEIANKKWGIIGLGNIGREVATVASAFGAEISYYSTSGKNTNSDFKQQSLDELLSTSDIISIHAPLNDNTKDLIRLNELKKMKSNSILVNLGRGGIINEEDLSTFLDDSSECKFGLDVLSLEPMDPKLSLKKHLNSKNIIITPHIAWASQEARERLLDQICLNIKSFMKD